MDLGLTVKKRIDYAVAGSMDYLEYPLSPGMAVGNYNAICSPKQSTIDEAFMRLILMIGSSPLVDDFILLVLGYVCLAFSRMLIDVLSGFRRVLNGDNVCIGYSYLRIWQATQVPYAGLCSSWRWTHPESSQRRRLPRSISSNLSGCSSRKVQTRLASHPVMQLWSYSGRATRVWRYSVRTNMILFGRWTSFPALKSRCGKSKTKKVIFCTAA